jgi:YGGT family
MDRNTKRWILWVGRLVVLIVYLVFLAYAVIVGIAFVLKLLGANPESDFADWIYDASASITDPFRGIFPSRSTPITDTSTFDASLLFALIVYLVVAVGFHAIVNWFTRQISGLDRQEQWERMQASIDAQRDIERAAFSTEPPPVTETVPTGGYSWEQPAGATPPTAPPPPPADPAYPPQPQP